MITQERFENDNRDPMMKGILRTMRRFSTHLFKINACMLMLGLAACTGGSGTSGDETGEDKGTEAQPNPLSVVFGTDRGTFEIRLRPDLAPLSVTNFCNLVQRGFYHGMEVSAANQVSRTIGETGRTPKYELEPEYSTTLFFDRPGVIAWSTLPRSSESEEFTPHPTRFFITVLPQERWNFQYVPFGTVEGGGATVDETTVGDWVRSARVKGDPTWLYEAYSDQLAEWNAALDAAGHTRAGEKSMKAPGLPINSN